MDDSTSRFRNDEREHVQSNGSEQEILVCLFSSANQPPAGLLQSAGQDDQIQDIIVSVRNGKSSYLDVRPVKLAFDASGCRIGIILGRSRFEPSVKFAIKERW